MFSYPQFVTACAHQIRTYIVAVRVEAKGWDGLYTRKVITELPYSKTNKMAFAPSDDSDQPGHPPRLIRVFAVHMEKQLGSLATH